MLLLQVGSSLQTLHRLVSEKDFRPEHVVLVWDFTGNTAATPWEIVDEPEESRVNKERGLQLIGKWRESGAYEIDGNPIAEITYASMAHEASGYDHRELQTTCSDGESFYITYPDVIQYEGCYEATSYTSENEVIYSTGSGLAAGDTLVLAYPINQAGNSVQVSHSPSLFARMSSSYAFDDPVRLPVGIRDRDIF